MHIVLFGDQQPDCRDFLQQVFNIKDNIILKSFLDRVTIALHQELKSQPHRSHCKRIPRFSTVKNLVEQYYVTDQSNTALDSAILCVAQLSHFIWLASLLDGQRDKC